MATKEVANVELRAFNRMHGVLTPQLMLEVKRGDVLIVYDLAETLRQQRPVYTVSVLSVDKNVLKDLR